jgi:hypothetical protein
VLGGEVSPAALWATAIDATSYGYTGPMGDA